MAQEPRRAVILMYGPAIHASIAEGDLGKMKQLAADAEKHLADHGDVRAALETLKAEIAKAERKP